MFWQRLVWTRQSEIAEDVTTVDLYHNLATERAAELHLTNEAEAPEEASFILRIQKQHHTDAPHITAAVEIPQTLPSTPPGSSPMPSYTPEAHSMSSTLAARQAKAQVKA
jgi:hypothetical protein